MKQVRVVEMTKMSSFFLNDPYRGIKRSLKTLVVTNGGKEKLLLGGLIGANKTKNRQQSSAIELVFVFS